MRKALYALPIAAAAFATPALAQPDRYYGGPYSDPYVAAAPWVGGAAVGTVAALGAYHGWFEGAVLPSTGAGAAAFGGVAAIGTVALIDGVIQPCRGFQALFGLNHGRCVNGQYVGDVPRRVSSRERGRRVYR